MGPYLHMIEALKQQGSKVAKIAFRRENIGENHLLPNCAYKYGIIETYSVQTVSFAINMTFFDQCGGGELGPSRCAGLSEVAWRLSQTYVYIRFRKPSSFRVCFSSPAFPGLEKYAVYSMTAEGSRLAGSPNKSIQI